MVPDGAVQLTTRRSGARGTAVAAGVPAVAGVSNATLAGNCQQHQKTVPRNQPVTCISTNEGLNRAAQKLRVIVVIIIQLLNHGSARELHADVQFLPDGGATAQLDMPDPLEARAQVLS